MTVTDPYLRALALLGSACQIGRAANLPTSLPASGTTSLSYESGGLTGSIPTEVSPQTTCTSHISTNAAPPSLTPPPRAQIGLLTEVTSITFGSNGEFWLGLDNHDQ